MGHKMFLDLSPFLPLYYCIVEKIELNSDFCKIVSYHFLKT